ncbi:VWA domain-containing protein [bacterium]|nr:VWA domain-containing protein [bacterium]
MKNYYLIILLFLIILTIKLSAQADNYNVYKPENYSKVDTAAQERVLFILDFSNSMTEVLGGATKLDMMLSTIRKILPALNPDASIGLRVYGHRMGFTQFDACHASTLMNPIQKNNTANLLTTLSRVKPRGMTPITFSLKQAVTNDFMGFSGKKHIILLTDGGENCDESPCEYVMELIKYRKDVTIDVIAFNIANQEDLAQLECTSLVTSGKFYTANTAAELANSLNDSLNKQKKVEAKIILPP